MPGALFDLDGTLIDFEGAAHVALNTALTGSVLAHLNNPEPVSWEMHASIVGRKGTEWSVLILEQLGIPESMLTPAAYLANWHAELKAFYPKMTLMPGALSVVTRLKQSSSGWKIAIATSSERKGMLEKTSYHPELMALVDFVVTGDQVVHGKPAPDIFLKAAAGLGLPPSQCVVFEDAPAGVEAGKRAGCRVIAIPDRRFATWNSSRFSLADEIITSLDYFNVMKGL